MFYCLQRSGVITPCSREPSKLCVPTIASQRVSRLGEAWSKLEWREIELPNLIFLDFELSRDYDHELVQILKNTDDLSATPVVVFADSADREDIGLTYRLQVSCFVVLPKDRELRQRKIEACLEFWSKYALLPELRRWWGEA